MFEDLILSRKNLNFDSYIKEDIIINGEVALSGSIKYGDALELLVLHGEVTTDPDKSKYPFFSTDIFLSKLTVFLVSIKQSVPSHLWYWY